MARPVGAAGGARAVGGAVDVEPDEEQDDGEEHRPGDVHEQPGYQVETLLSEEGGGRAPRL